MGGNSHETRWHRGNSVLDKSVIKALLQVLMARYKAKYGADPTSVLRVIAEDPITVSAGGGEPAQYGAAVGG